ncbi:MAG TPA: bacteriocin-protection protein, partial [Candidatus Dormibacteraeota bacterium]|nr:bacteriocin-protection protein [Candidatus Dormibacteraeota bacterium]
MPTPDNVIFFESPGQLRAWFEEHHEGARELWVGFHKKRSGRPSITWQQLVDQELCFGWIDSVRYSLGDDRSAQRVTPRRKGSVWSAVNIRRFEQLDEQGLVHPAGRAAFDRRDDARSRVYSYENWPRDLDAESEATFRKHEAAWKFFETQPPSYRRTAA